MTTTTSTSTSTSSGEIDDEITTVTDDTSVEEGCTPADECQLHRDCLPGQTCLANCTCFGEPSGETEDDCYDAQGVYGDCVSGGGDVCMNQNAGCITAADPSSAGVCYFNCTEVCDCPAPPDGITVGCQDLAGDGPICFLDCTGGKPCPADMFCFSNTACVHSAQAGSCAGSCGVYDRDAPCRCDSECFGFGDCCADICDECDTDFPAQCEVPAYEDCANDGPAICQLNETCIQASEENMDWGICAVTGCTDAADCAEGPEDGTAPVACGDLGGGNVCYLDCGNEQHCPAGMSCTPEGNCAFEGPGFLLYEGFDDGELPAEWTVVDVDMNVPDDAVSWVTDAWVVTDMIVNDFAAVSTSWYDPSDQADDWLITPPITLGSSSVLSWRALAPNGDFADGYEVRVSTTGATVADFMDAPVLSIAAEQQVYTYRSVDLATEGYANEEVWIAFRNNSDDMFLLFVDDIAVTQ